MARSKPNHIQVHRIELGGWERERYKNAELVAAATVLLPALGIAAAGVASAAAAYALYQYLSDFPFKPLTDSINDVVAPIVAGEEGVSQVWGTKNPFLQIFPNLGWLRGSEYSAWW